MLKSLLKNKHQLTHSCEYWNISSHPVNTCPFIDKIKILVLQLKEQATYDESKFILSELEDLRARCDSIRKETLILKTKLWEWLELIIKINGEINEEEYANFLNWEVSAYTDPDLFKLKKIKSLLLEDKFENKVDFDFLKQQFISVEVNLIKLDEWRSEYIKLINLDKNKMVSMILKDLN